MRVLGIETSCDETGVAVYAAAHGLLAHAVHTQIAIHAEFGGVGPELASRDHVRRLPRLVRRVLQESDSGPGDIGGIAYTAGPGLVGALLVGTAFGGVMYATSEASLSGTQLLAVSPSSIMWTLLGWTVLGALIGGAGQAMAQPAALAGDEAEEARAVRKRITDGLAMPVLATLVIAVIVVSFGSLLLRFSGFAPLIAILVSIGTIGFAALMSSRPNLRVTRGEFLVAAAGVGVVLMMLAVIAAAVSGDGHEDGAGEPAGHALEYVTTDPASR